METDNPQKQVKPTSKYRPCADTFVYLHFITLVSTPAQAATFLTVAEDLPPLFSPPFDVKRDPILGFCGQFGKAKQEGQFVTSLAARWRHAPFITPGSRSRDAYWPITWLDSVM